MYCRDCGEKTVLRFVEQEGLVPFCPKCGTFKFPLFPVAVSMTVVNRAEDKILLAKHVNENDYTLIAGYIKKGENAEKAIPREIKEETKLNAIKWRYFGSRYHDAKDVLMLNFIVTADEGAIELNENELTEARWCTPAEAKELIRKNSTAEYFLNGALNELGKRK
ncbi:MAG: NUDIX domain-containing protein [Clostridia bacterium]|jgi:NAD+ diphosphatase|nr:NUDIX domain-containing protein [Clostridia bacterium]